MNKYTVVSSDMKNQYKHLGIDTCLDAGRALLRVRGPREQEEFGKAVLIGLLAAICKLDLNHQIAGGLVLPCKVGFIRPYESGYLWVALRALEGISKGYFEMGENEYTVIERGVGGLTVTLLARGSEYRIEVPEEEWDLLVWWSSCNVWP